MGYTYRNNGQIKDYWPDDDDKTIYLSDDTDLDSIIDKVKEKWGKEVDLSNVSISSEYIHTECLTYDLYDSGDYTPFIVIRKVN